MAYVSIMAGVSIQTGWGTKGSCHLADPPSKIQIGPQRAVAGGGTSKCGGGTGKGTQAIIDMMLGHTSYDTYDAIKSFSLTQALKLFERHHAPDAHTTDFDTEAISGFPIFPLNIFVIFGPFLLTLSS